MAGFLIQKVNKNFKIIIEESLIETFVVDLMPYAKFFGVTFHMGDENVLGHVVDSLEKSNNNSFLTNGSFDLEVEIKEDKKSISNEISQDKWQIANKIALNHAGRAAGGTATDGEDGSRFGGERLCFSTWVGGLADPHAVAESGDG